MIKSIVNTFLPWTIYLGLTKWLNCPISLSAAMVILINILFYRKALFQYCYILSWTNIGLFLLIFINACILHSHGIENYMTAISYGIFFIMGILSLLFKNPFTLQYAKQEVDNSKWQHPAFLKINFVLTIIWTIIFLFNFMINIAPKDTFYKWNLYVVSFLATLFGIIFTIKFPNIYRKKYANISKNI